MAINYRQLNRVTKDDGYKIPTTGDLIGMISLKQPSIFSKLIWKVAIGKSDGRRVYPTHNI